jgi:hypothetical protein
MLDSILLFYGVGSMLALYFYVMLCIIGICEASKIIPIKVKQYVNIPEYKTIHIAIALIIVGIMVVGLSWLSVFFILDVLWR